MKDCDCEGWKKNMKHIDRCIDSARIHGVVLTKEYEMFKYCPWCGREGEKE